MASTIKVDNVQNTPGTNIVSKCGTDVTLGASGDTVALASGASQTGFGRTGTVDWQTGDIKTATFTAATGKGYFCNTTGGVLTVNLPAGSAGDIVGLKDYAGTWDSNAITIAPDGSEKIGGDNVTDPTIENEGGSLLLVYVDGTQGWLTTQESVTTSPTGGENFIVATGGTPCTGAIVCTNYKQHTFTGPGTFCVSTAATCSANNAVAYVVVAGGGGGGKDRAGGGGAGGFREGTTAPIVPYTASPLVAATGITVTASPYTIAVGGGATGVPNCLPAQSDAGTGAVSTFDSITSAGGGRAGSGPSASYSTGGDGGSGGGSDAYGYPSSAPNMAAGSGNVPATPIAQGFDGGVGVYNSPNGSGRGGGGGGATVVGGGGSPTGNSGGAGATTSIDGTPTAYGGGGGGGDCGSGPPIWPQPQGGTGGGGGGGSSGASVGSGTVNTGGGGGGSNGGTGCGTGAGGAGGSGVVIIRYKFQ